MIQLDIHNNYKDDIDSIVKRIPSRRKFPRYEQIGEIRTQPLFKKDRPSIVDIDYVYDFEERPKARVLDIMCVKTKRGIRCLKFKDLHTRRHLCR